MEVLDVLEGPLLGAEGESWIEDGSISRVFSEFLRVQALSDKASQDVESWRSSLRSIMETKKEHVFEHLWYNINKVNQIGYCEGWLCSHDVRSHISRSAS